MMNSKKSSKWIIAVASVLLVIVCFVIGLAVTNKSYAAEAQADNTYITEYFSGTGSVNHEVKFENDAMVLSLKEGQTAKFKRNLKMSDFALNFKLSDGFEKLTLELTRGTSVGSNSITDKVVFTKDGSNVKAVLNEKGDGATVAYGATDELALTVTNGSLYLGTQEVGALTLSASEYFGFSVIAGKDADISFTNICKQNFVMTSSGNFQNKQPAAFKLNDSFYTETKEGSSSVITKLQGMNSYNLTIEYIGVAYNKAYTNLKIKEKNGEDKITEYGLPSSNKIVFFKAGLVDVDFINDSDEVVYTVQVKVVDTDDAAPEYLDKEENALVYGAFEQALEDCVYKEDGSKIEKGEKVTLPSFKGFVKDNTIEYESLTYTVHYKGNSVDSSSSGTCGDGISFTVSEEGIYEFYVVFSDGKNQQEATDEFIEAWTFSLPELRFATVPTVKASTSRVVVGYIGTSYTVNSFTVSGQDTTKYKLEYAASKDAANWTEILSESDDKDDKFDENYDGNLTFVPQKKGFYRLTCTAFHEYETASDSLVVEIVGAPIVVKPATQLTTNNILSIVFLCIGGAALVGLLCVIFIKPKKKED